MIVRALFTICTILCFLACSSNRVVKVQVILFDTNGFSEMKTLNFENPDTLKRIESLFDNKFQTYAKFPRRYQVTFYSEGVTETYSCNGNHVRFDHKVYELRPGKDWDFFQSVLNGH